MLRINLIEKNCAKFKKFQLFFVIDRINKRKYRSSDRIGANYTLCERFQLLENIRLSKLLKNTIILGSIGSSITIFVCYTNF